MAAGEEGGQGMNPGAPAMTSELVSLADGRVALTIEAEWSDVSADYEDLLTAYGKLALPGFRPGKAPRTAVERRFRRQLGDDLTSRCGRRLARLALGERGLRAAGAIEVVAIEVEADRRFSFTAEFVPLPELELPDYAALELAGAAGDERRDEACEWLLERTPGEMPEALVREELERSEASGDGGGDEARQAAARRVKLLAILEQIAEAEGIDVAPPEVDARIERMAGSAAEAADLRRRLEREDGLARLRSLMRAEQTLEFLVAGRTGRREGT